MGEKGARLMDQADQSCKSIVGTLSGLGRITSKKMFGGFGIFEEKTMFALINSQGDVFFKSDESTIPKFEEEGSGKHSRMPYYLVPDKILNDKNKIQEWAKESIEIAHRAKK
jgi:DNA transformation protein